MLANIFFATAIVIEVPVFNAHKPRMETGVKIGSRKIKSRLYEEPGKVHVDIALQCVTAITHIGVGDKLQPPAIRVML